MNQESNVIPCPDIPVGSAYCTNFKDYKSLDNPNLTQEVWYVIPMEVCEPEVPS